MRVVLLIIILATDALAGAMGVAHAPMPGAFVNEEGALDAPALRVRGKLPKKPGSLGVEDGLLRFRGPLGEGTAPVVIESAGKPVRLDRLHDGAVVRITAWGGMALGSSVGQGFSPRLELGGSAVAPADEVPVPAATDWCVRALLLVRSGSVFAVVHTEVGAASALTRSSVKLGAGAVILAPASSFAVRDAKAKRVDDGFLVEVLN